MGFHQTILARNICHIKHRLLSLSAQNRRPHLSKCNERSGIVEIGPAITLLGIPKVSKRGRKPTMSGICNGVQVVAKNIEQMATAFTPHTTYSTPLLKQQLGDATSKIKPYHMRNCRGNEYQSLAQIWWWLMHISNLIHLYTSNTVQFILCQLYSVNLFKTK